RGQDYTVEELAMRSAAVLSAATAPVEFRKGAFNGIAEKASLRGGGGLASAPLVQPTIRTKFADTALWVGSLSTNENGEAEVSLDMPENLTTWKVKVWGMGHG